MSKKKVKAPKESFEDYVKLHGDEEVMPFDDALRRIVNAPPRPKASGDKPPPKKPASREK